MSIFKAEDFRTPGRKPDVFTAVMLHDGTWYIIKKNALSSYADQLDVEELPEIIRSEIEFWVDRQQANLEADKEFKSDLIPTKKKTS